MDFSHPFSPSHVDWMDAVSLRELSETLPKLLTGFSVTVGTVVAPVESTGSLGLILW